MQIAYITVGNFAVSGGAASIAPSKPAGTTATTYGVMIAKVSSKNNATHGTATSGWNLINQHNSGANFTTSYWWAFENAAAPTFTWTGSVACDAIIALYSEPNNPVDQTAPIGNTNFNNGVVSPWATTSITSGRDGSLFVLIGSLAANGTIDNPSGWTNRAAQGSGTSATTYRITTKPGDPSGTTSGNTSATSQAATAWTGAQLEIRVAVGSNDLSIPKVETGALITPTIGFATPKVETGVWLNKINLAEFSKVETGALLIPPVGFSTPKVETGVWLRLDSKVEFAKVETGVLLIPPTDAVSFSKVETGVWLIGTATNAWKRAAQIIG